MKLILTQDIDRLGKAGDVVDVAEGYARNFLLPNSKAKAATAGNMKLLEARRKKEASDEARKVEAARALANRIGNLSITIAVQAGEEEKLFGSVTSEAVSERLKEEGIEIDKKDILLEEPIKKLGVYQISAKVHPEVKATLRVWIVKK
ncbi:MAG: 50S ribosomal protein L9 [Candidatus Omnitrophica bacterium]|nr:50S ribosomal protein L9 [Candidatus Omnitrophota bacterium]